MTLDEMKKLEGELEAKILGEPKEPEKESGDAQKKAEKPKATKPENERSLETQEVDTPPEAPVETTEVTAEQHAQLDKRFRKYKASTDKTIFELRQEKRDLLGKLAKALEDVKKLEDQIEKLKEDTEPEYPFTEEDEKVVGPEAMAIFKKAFKESAKRNVDPERLERSRKADEQIQNLRKAAESEPLETPRDRFISDLTEEYPDWRDTIASPKFREFLKIEDSFGLSHEDKWRAAESKLNTGPLLKILKAFEEQENPFDEHISPNESSSGIQRLTPDTDRKIYTQAEINEFFKNKQLGYYNKNSELIAEAARIEAEIDRQINDQFYGKLR